MQPANATHCPPRLHWSILGLHANRSTLTSVAYTPGDLKEHTIAIWCYPQRLTQNLKAVKNNSIFWRGVGLWAVSSWSIHEMDRIMLTSEIFELIYVLLLVLTCV